MSLDSGRRRPDASESSIGDAFFPLYQRVFDEDDEFVRSVERKLSEARMADNVELFISRALAVATLVGLVLWALGMFVGFLFVQLFVSPDAALIGIPVPGALDPAVDLLKIPSLVFVSGLVVGSLGFSLGFGAMLSLPYIRSNGRRREINVLLADSISFMYALSAGGLNQLEIIRAMATAEDTYGEVSKEFRSIVLETEYFDTEYRTAIRKQSLETPSESLSQFLTDMLSIIDSGGDMTSFLEDQKDKHMRTTKQEQEKLLDTLELFGEMYMTLSLFPLLLIIILVIMSMMGNIQTLMLYGTVYGLIPMIGVGFLVLVSTVTQDTVGDGYIDAESAGVDLGAEQGIGVFNPGLVTRYTGEHGVFDKIKRREQAHELSSIVRAPHIFFRDHPRLVLLLTVPVSLLALGGAVVTSNAPLSVDGMLDDPIYGTFVWVYIPLYINLIPLAIFYEWNVRSRRSVLGNLSETLRKLASANDTGMTLLESFRVVADTSTDNLAEEFETLHAKVKYGTDLKSALREFNNKYHIPRLARIVKLVSEAQEASGQIQDVLSTAAQASENQDDIDRDRITRTRMQVVIILMTYLTLLGVMALLKLQFLDVMAGLANQASGASTQGPSGDFGGNVDTALLSMLFFHAVVLQALVSSFIAGYIRSVELTSGAKFAVILATIALVVWVAATQVTESGDETALFLLVAIPGLGARHPRRGPEPDWGSASSNSTLPTATALATQSNTRNTAAVQSPRNRNCRSGCTQPRPSRPPTSTGPAIYDRSRDVPAGVDLHTVGQFDRDTVGDDRSDP